MAIMARDDDLGDCTGRPGQWCGDGMEADWDLVSHVRLPAAGHWPAASRVAPGRRLGDAGDVRRHPAWGPGLPSQPRAYGLSDQSEDSMEVTLWCGLHQV